MDGNISVSTSFTPDHASDLLRGRFVIPAEEVQRALSSSSMRMEDLLMSLIQPASRLARPPVSGYHVGWEGGRCELGAWGS